MLLHALARWSLVVASLIPSILIVAALLVSRRAPFRTAAFVTPLTAVFAVVAVTLHALVSPAAHGADPLKLRAMMNGRVQLDLASSAMLLLVCALALVVVRYSRTYLAGERGLVRYERSLLMTIASVTLLVISNYLEVLIAAWLATGVGLHQLLTFYGMRRQAIIVAHKKFLLSRIADLCFLASLVLVENEVGSLHIDVVNTFARAHESLPPALHVATVLLVVGVLLKTAQLPFHGWILQVMEAPTPVSALLHAGVVNIGGFVMIRLAPLMARASIAQGLLLTVGLITAIVGSLVMTTRSSVKVALAWSTIAQMGFMLVQCGLGAWDLALLHLLAHSLYKAHAFLSTGAAVESWRGASLVPPPRISPGLVVASLALLGLAAAPLYVAYALSGLHASASLGPLVLALGLSFVPMLGRALAAGRPAVALAVRFTLGATAAYFAWHALLELVASSSDTAATTSSAASSLKWAIVTAGLVVLFIAQTVLQTSPSGRLARLLEPHMLSGLYIDEWFTRLAFRLWPPRLERPASQRSGSEPSQEAHRW